MGHWILWQALADARLAQTKDVKTRDPCTRERPSRDGLTVASLCNVERLFGYVSFGFLARNIDCIAPIPPGFYYQGHPYVSGHHGAWPNELVEAIRILRETVPKDTVEVIVGSEL